jgi:hypothetical protein
VTILRGDCRNSGCELDPDYADMAEARLRATLL